MNGIRTHDLCDNGAIIKLNISDMSPHTKLLYIMKWHSQGKVDKIWAFWDYFLKDQCKSLS